MHTLFGRVAGFVVVMSLFGCSQAPMEVSVGEQRIFRAEGMTAVAVGDKTVADLVALENGEVLILGVAPGHTTLRFSTGTKSHELDIDVRAQGGVAAKAGPAAGDVTPEPEALTLKAGQVSVRKMARLNRVAVADPEIVDIKVTPEGLELSALKEGTTTVLFWFDDKPREALSISVSP